MNINSWHQLVVVHSAPAWGESIASHFWPRAFESLDKANLAKRFPAIDDDPRFHIRFAGNTDGRGRYIELLRFHGVSGDSGLGDALLSNARAPHVLSATWEEITLPQSNRFLTFLEACSILRVRNGISIGRDLSGFTNGATYDTCPLCSEAFQVMRGSDMPWSQQLRPWFEHLDTIDTTSAFASDNRFEYAHWFGHILSQRGITF